MPVPGAEMKKAAWDHYLRKAWFQAALLELSLIIGGTRWDIVAPCVGNSLLVLRCGVNGSEREGAEIPGRCPNYRRNG
jgi:hypothetical protein